MNPKLHQLSNGLSVITAPMKGVESLTVMLLANTGSRFEPIGKEGLAHFLEHMVFKGTKKYLTAQKLAATIDALGADFNAFTSHEYTGYYVKAAAKHLSTAVDVLSDMLLQPTLNEEDIEREKGVIVEEINMYHDQPASHVGNLFARMVYQGSGLGHDIIGTKDSVTAIKSADFRAFLSQWYGLGNLVLVLAGKAEVVESAETLKLVEEMFDKKTEDRLEGKQEIRELLSDDQLAKQRLHLEQRETQQAHFILAWPGINRTDERKYAAYVLSALMGGNMSSRLFTEVREKRGLCYYVRSTTDQFHDKGIFGVSAGVDPGRVEEAIQVSADEFHKLATGKQKLTKSELSRAQEYLIGKWALNMEDSDTMAQFVGLRQVLLGEIETVQEMMRKIQAVTLEEVNQVARELILPGEARLALIGPYDDQDKFGELIKNL